MNSLYIDTRDNQKITVIISNKDKKFMAETTPKDTKADSVLMLIERVCKSAGISMRNLEKIYCEKGPGSHTGLRVGFAIANTLSLALLIPLNDNKIGTVDVPIYS